MKLSKVLKLLLIAAAIMTALCLFACGDNEANNENPADGTESSEQTECIHENKTVNSNCESVCSDCGVVLGAAEHTPAAPDAEDHCNVKCSNCGKLLEENKHGKEVLDSECYTACENCGDRFSDKAKHTKSEPDPEDHCNIKCTNCGLVMFEGKHARTTVINDKCEEVCSACGDKMSDVIQHLEPEAGAWAFDPERPQCESAECGRCGNKMYRDVTATPNGLTLIGPDQLVAAIHNGRVAVEAGVDDNGLKFARIEITQAGEGTVTVNDGKEALMGVGKFVAVLARRSGLTGGVDFWVNYAGKEGPDGGLYKTAPINCENRWELLLFDFSSVAQVNKDNGIGWSRIDMNPETAIGDTMDIAYIAFFDSADEAAEYYGDYIRAYLGADACSHTVDNVWKALGDGKIGMTCTACKNDVNVLDCTHFDFNKLSNITPKAEADSCYFTADCALCGATSAKIPSLTQEQGRVFAAAQLNAIAFVQASLGIENNGGYARYSSEFVSDDGSLPYTRFVSKIDHENCLLLNDGKTSLKGINRYVAILYRKSGSSPNIEMLITPSGQTAPGNHVSKTVSTVNDGNWNLAIIDLGDSNKVDVVNGAGWLRLDILNVPDVKIGDTIDIAYVGFFSSTEKAYEHYMGYLGEYLGVDNCCHSFVTDWAGTGKENEMQNNCVICKKLVVKACDHVSNGPWSKTENEGEIKSTCTRCNAEFVKACEHPDKTYNQAAGFFNYSFTCNVCGISVNEENKNSKDALHIFDGETIVEIAGPETSSAKGTYTTVLMTDETTGLKYSHSVLSATSAGECFLYLNKSETDIISATGGYFVILYRQNGELNTGIDCFISADASLSEKHRLGLTVNAGGGWTLGVFDYSKSKGWDYRNGAAIIRLDIFNHSNIAEGSYFDIAYAGFFSSAEAANEFYNEFAAAYGLK